MDKEIANPGGADEFTLRSVLVRTSTGYYVAGALTDPSKLALYDSSGVFIRNSGKSGDGPGEFRSIEDLLVSRADSVFVLEESRITVLSPPPSLRYVRSFPTGPMARDVDQDRSGSVLVTSPMLFEGMVAQHSIEGPPVSKYREMKEGEFFGPVTALGDTFWIARSLAALEAWTARSDRIREVPLKSAELGRSLKSAKNNGRRGPMVTNLQSMSNGYLWISWLDFSQTNEPGVESNGGGGDGRPKAMSVGEWDDWARAVVEVVDPRDGSSVVTLKPGFNVGGFLDGNQLYTIREDSAGNTSIQIMAMTVHGLESRRD